MTSEERKAYDKARRATPEHKAYDKAYNATPERQAYNKVYNATPERKAYSKAYNKVYHKAYYATPEQVAKRNGIIAITWPKPSLCEACGKTNRDGRSLAADHCHATGLHRGWLCGTCNTALGAAGDDLVPFKAWGGGMVRYLERFEHRDGYLK